MRFIPFAAFGAALLCGCITYDLGAVSERSVASIQQGLQACERYLSQGEPLPLVVAAIAPGATAHPTGFNMPEYRTIEPSWQLTGGVYVAPETVGRSQGCTVVAYFGESLRMRDAVLQSLLSGTGEWFKISVLGPQPDDERDAACTPNGVADSKALGVVMTTSKGQMRARKLIATMTLQPAEDCTARRL
jgi:hypothetical protein